MPSIQKIKPLKSIFFGLFMGFISCIGLFSCGDVDEKKETPMAIEADTLSGKKVAKQKEQLFALGANLEDLPLTDEMLFGHFFSERAHFYIIKKPNLNIFGSSVEEVTFYFVDSVLAKCKYQLKDDISNRLINSLGKFKIKPLNADNKKILNAEKVVTRENGWYRLNPTLNEFELSWDRREYLIHMRVNKKERESSPLYEFVEETTYYREALKFVEHFEATD